RRFGVQHITIRYRGISTASTASMQLVWTTVRHPKMIPPSQRRRASFHRIAIADVCVALTTFALVATATSASADEAEYEAGPSATISGTPQVGKTLTVDEGSPFPEPDSYAYQWLADDEEVDGANGKSFDLG